MALSKEEIFKKKPSPEEIKYTTAVELMDAIDCVERFEQAVFSLRSAAKKFEDLGDYKDSVKLRQECVTKADKLEREGCEETLQKAENMLQGAKTKSDFIAVSSEYRRLKKTDEYRERGIEGITICRKGIRKIETRKVYKRWCVLLILFAILAVVVVQTPLIFLVKGVAHRVRGEYRAAIRCYKQIESFPGIQKMERSCYYKIAEKHDEKNDYKKAMKLYHKSGAYSEAESRSTGYQKRFIREAKKGDTVFYAGMYWVILEKNYLQERVLLVKKSALKKGQLPKNKDVEEKKLLKYLNSDFASANFSDTEKVMMGKKITPKKRAGVATLETPPDQIVENPLFILSDSAYQSYENVLPEDWDAAGVHPAVWVNYH